MSQIEITKTWNHNNLSKITQNFDGLRVPLNKSQRLNLQGSYPYYGASGQIDSINDYKFDGKFLLIAEDGENLNSRKKPIAFIVEGKFWVNNHAHVLQPNEDIDIRYLCYYLNSLNIMNYAKKQATRPKLKKSDLDKIPITYPKLSVQKKIVQKLDYILGQLEEKKKIILEKRELTLKNLEIIKQRLFRFYISRIIPYEKQKGLEEKQFSELTSSYDSLRIPMNRTQRLTMKGPYPYYGASGQVDSINDFKFDGRFLLISEDGENLNTQKKPIAFIVEGKFWVNNHAHVIQTLKELDLDYLGYYLNGLNIMKFAKKQATRPKLKKSDLDKIPIVYPSHVEQKEIVKKIQAMQKKTDSLNQNLNKILEEYENSSKYIENLIITILDKAFSGRIVS